MCNDNYTRQAPKSIPVQEQPQPLVHLNTCLCYTCTAEAKRKLESSKLDHHIGTLDTSDLPPVASTAHLDSTTERLAAILTRVELSRLSNLMDPQHHYASDVQFLLSYINRLGG